MRALPFFFSTLASGVCTCVHCTSTAHGSRIPPLTRLKEKKKAESKSRAPENPFKISLALYALLYSAQLRFRFRCAFVFIAQVDSSLFLRKFTVMTVRFSYLRCCAWEGSKFSRAGSFNSAGFNNLARCNLIIYHAVASKFAVSPLLLLPPSGLTLGSPFFAACVSFFLSRFPCSYVLSSLLCFSLFPCVQRCYLSPGGLGYT